MRHVLQILDPTTGHILLDINDMTLKETLIYDVTITANGTITLPPLPANAELQVEMISGYGDTAPIPPNVTLNRSTRRLDVSSGGPGFSARIRVVEL
jgi:hypothetical protein